MNIVNPRSCRTVTLTDTQRRVARFLLSNALLLLVAHLSS